MSRDERLFIITLLGKYVKVACEQHPLPSVFSVTLHRLIKGQGKGISTT